jgi:hypothetical protein
MGYTHYWTNKPRTEKSWKSFTAACKKLHKNLPKTTDTAGGYHEDDPLEIAGGLGEGKPLFNKNMVWFNGKDDERDLGHETFCVQNTEHKADWSFCKTARKPYDLLVVACLIAGWQNDILRFSSDGFNQNETCNDLQPAIDFYNEIMQPEVPITQDLVWKQRLEYYQIRGK